MKLKISFTFINARTLHLHVHEWGIDHSWPKPKNCSMLDARCLRSWFIMLDWMNMSTVQAIHNIPFLPFNIWSDTSNREDKHTQNMNHIWMETFWPIFHMTATAKLVQFCAQASKLRMKLKSASYKVDMHQLGFRPSLIYHLYL